MGFRPQRALKDDPPFGTGGIAKKGERQIQAHSAMQAGAAEHAELADEYNAKLEEINQAVAQRLGPLNDIIDKANQVFAIVNDPAAKICRDAEQQAQADFQKAVAEAKADLDAKISLARMQYVAAIAGTRDICDKQVREATAQGKAITRDYGKQRDALVAEFKQKQFMIMKRLKAQGVVVGANRERAKTVRNLTVTDLRWMAKREESNGDQH